MGKPKHSDDGGRQKGAQQHAEGQHGKLTRKQLEAQTSEERALHETHSKREANDPNRHGKGGAEAHAVHEEYLEKGELASDGKHQLFEGRKDHDEADRKQNKNRLDKDVSKHGHDRDRFQLEGGREHSGPDSAIKSPQSGGK